VVREFTYHIKGFSSGRFDGERSRIVQGHGVFGRKGDRIVVVLVVDFGHSDVVGELVYTVSEKITSKSMVHLPPPCSNDRLRWSKQVRL
jgi:hypothetical protein